jgi:hypothetical protein
MASNIFESLIAKECLARGLDTNLLTAIIQVESSFNPWAMRFEPASRTLVTPSQFAKLLGITTATEETAQKSSWGLGQVMGSTARWLGFHGSIPQLCDPETGIYWACEYFQKNCLKNKGLSAQIASYNAGSVRRNQDGTIMNQAYVDRVLGVYERGSHI